MATELSVRVGDKLYQNRNLVDSGRPHIRVREHTTPTAPLLALLKAGPTRCYEPADKGQVETTPDGCLECGACRIIGEPAGDIEWRYPRGGYGVLFEFGWARAAPDRRCSSVGTALPGVLIEAVHGGDDGSRSRVAQAVQGGFDLGAVEKNDVLLPRGADVRRGIEAEALQGVEQKRAPHVHHRGTASNAVVDGNGSRLPTRKARMRRDAKANKAPPVDIVLGDRAGVPGAFRLRHAAEDEVTEFAGLAVECSCVPAEPVMRKRVGLDDPPGGPGSAHRLIRDIQSAAMADRPEDRAQDERIHRALGDRRRVEWRRHSKHRVLGGEGADIDQTELPEQTPGVRRRLRRPEVLSRDVSLRRLVVSHTRRPAREIAPDIGGSLAHRDAEAADEIVAVHRADPEQALLDEGQALLDAPAQMGTLVEA